MGDCIFCKIANGEIPSATLFEDEEFLNMVIEAMKSDPQFGGMAGMMVPTLKLLPEIIKNTTQLEIGLDLTQVK